MEVELRPEQEARLNELAATSGRGTDELLQEAVDRLLSYNTWLEEQVQVGMDQIERGELIDEAEMNARVKSWFNP
jgi:predicted transcriptional regulator